jgi:hypothetical protein
MVPTGRAPGGAAGTSGAGPAGFIAEDGQAGNDGDGPSSSFAASSAAGDPGYADGNGDEADGPLW